MHTIDHVYIDGRFVEPRGDDWAELHNPATEAVIGRVRLGDARDVDAAVAAAKKALSTWRLTTKQERIEALKRLADAVSERHEALAAAMREEYGAPRSFVEWIVKAASESFRDAARTLAGYEFTRAVGSAQVTMTPVGVVAAITPWNANISFICGKLATAIAAGCSIVVKPSEMSARQTQVLLEALDAADLPPGVFNIVNGTGPVVGAALSAHPDVSKVTFTGSTATGKAILKAGADTVKRITLELGGKSPTILLDDADLSEAVPIALMSGIVNSGQACVAGTRILVPETRMDEVLVALKAAIEQCRVGPSTDPDAQVGPMVSQIQYDRVQGYIRLGQQEGATVLTGGEGRPDGHSRGWFVKPTIFANVTNDMRIAREEIFGPVLCVIGYRDDEEAITIANDTTYGLSAYILGKDRKRAARIANRMEAGRVVVNGAPFDPDVPFGGFKQSGIGREYGVHGLEAYLEPRAVMAI